MDDWLEGTGTDVSSGHRPRLIVLLLPLALVVGGFGWARSSWVGVLPYRIGLLGWFAGIGPCSTIRSDRVVLRLRPGGCGPYLPGMGVPDDIPPGEPSLQLPRYPGAAATDHPVAPSLMTPMDGYLKSASAALLVPAADPSTVARWYADRLPQMGYAASSENTGPEGTGSASDMVSTQGFSWSGEFERMIQVQVEPAGAGTLLLLEAQLPSPPPRPAASLVPADSASLTVEYGARGDAAQIRQWEAGAGLPGAGSHWWRTVRSGPTLARLARMVNAMPVLTGTHGSVIDPRFATLTFRAPGSRPLVYTLTMCCAEVTGPGVVLDASRGGLWDAIRALAPRR